MLQEINNLNKDKNLQEFLKIVKSINNLISHNTFRKKYNVNRIKIHHQI